MNETLEVIQIASMAAGATGTVVAGGRLLVAIFASLPLLGGYMLTPLKLAVWGWAVCAGASFAKVMLGVLS